MRTIREVRRGRREDVEDLVTRQAIPNDGMRQLDPFLLLNHHGPQVFGPGNSGLPFGPHPHRGFETVTFIVEGSLVHRDSKGHESAIVEGGVQWMTAGGGIEHAEVSSAEFMEKGGALDILQLWINLPKRLKMTPAKYTGLQKDAIPSVQRDGATVNVIAGTFGGVRGPIDSLTDVFMTTVALTAGSRVTLPAPRDREVLLYVVRGSLTAAGEYHLVELNDDGDEVELVATSDALVIFGHAAPLHEPVVSYGPFVMNTQQEIVEAIRDYQAGKF